MAKHVVKCAVCGEQFDTNSIQAVRYGARRYAHYSCYQEGELVPLGPEADPDLIALKDYISKLFKQPNWAMINKQLKKYKEEQGYSYTGILKSLIYFYEVKANSTDKANGSLGIVPYVYQDAYNYYYSLFMAQQGTINKELIIKEKEITIRPPRMLGTKHKLMKLGEEDE